MSIIFPVIAFALFVWHLRKYGFAWRVTLLAAAIFWATSLTIITEGLSVARGLTAGNVATAWLLLCAATVFYIVVRTRRARWSMTNNQIPPHDTFGKLDPLAKALIGLTACVIILVAVTAVAAPPSTWDAMTTHLPRVLMWMSNHSVQFYPTPDYLQLIEQPWAQYAMMHTIFLWGSDRLVNLVQFLSYLGSVTAVSLIAKHLGAHARGQILAALACATIPQGLLEASGPQNMYVVTFWITTTVVFLFEWNRNPNWFNTVCIGLSAGLAALTKGQAYIYLPFIGLTCWCSCAGRNRLLFLKRSAIFVALILALNFATFVRNYELTGSPLGLPLPTDFPRADMFIKDITVQRTAANIIRHLSVHMNVPNQTVNKEIEHVLRRVIRLIGANPDDPESNYLGEPFRINYFTRHEILAGNPLHLFVLGLSIFLIMARWKRGISGTASLYALGIVLGFVFLCMTLRWQIWTSRYHLPAFVLGAALIGLAMEQFATKKLGGAIVVLLLGYGLVFAAMNQNRSLVPWRGLPNIYEPRGVLYFADQHLDIAQSYITAAKVINRLSCKNIAIDSYIADPLIKHNPKSFFVYPLLALINPDGHARSLSYAGVQNLTTRYADASRQPPCAVVCIDCAAHSEKWREYRAVGGRATVVDDIVIFSKDGAVSNISQENP